MWQDTRFAWRMLAKTPGFTTIAVLCLALGIGANSTVFSLIDGMSMRPLPVRNPAELVHLFLATDRDPLGELSYPDYLEFHDHAQTLAGLAVTQRRGPILTGNGFAESTMSNVVSENYFTVLGINAQLGRVFTERDKDSGPVVVMSHNLWQRRFGADPSIVGKAVRLGRAYTVIGVAPGGFRGVEPWIDTDFWIPMSFWDSSPDGERSQRRWRSFAAIGRLRPEVPVEQSRSEIAGIARNLERSYPEFNRGRRGVLYSALEFKLRRAGYASGVLMGIVALVVLIACANVANLLLARAGVRSREIGLRVALGAKRSRLVRQLLTESALIAVLGAVAGLLLAVWAIQLLPAAVNPPGDATTHYEFRMDSRVLAFTFSLSLVTVLIFGLFPAWRASDHRHCKGQTRPHTLLVIGQLALSIVLLTGAGLLIRSFSNSLHMNLGFERKNVLVAAVSPPDAGQAQGREFYRQLIERVRARPGVREVTLALRPPLWGSEGGTAQGVEIPGRQLSAGEFTPQVKFNIVDRNYFRTLGIPLLKGRDFDGHDGPGTPKVVIVSETMARRFWPGEDPVGRFIHTMDNPAGVDRQVIGVVGDARINSVQETAESYFYLPHTQSNRGMLLLAETTGDPLKLADIVRAEVVALDSSVPVLDVSTLGLLIRASTFEQETAVTVAGALGAIGLFLAAVGLYGVISYTVVQRTREIGIRMALGAQYSEAMALILRQGLCLATIGTGIGLIGALATTRLLEKSLYGVSPYDPLTFACVAALMLAVALAASYIPARRATKVDPVAALRCD